MSYTNKDDKKKILFLTITSQPLRFLLLYFRHELGVCCLQTSQSFIVPPNNTAAADWAYYIRRFYYCTKICVWRLAIAELSAAWRTQATLNYATLLVAANYLLFKIRAGVQGWEKGNVKPQDMFPCHLKENCVAEIWKGRYTEHDLLFLETVLPIFHSSI